MSKYLLLLFCLTFGCYQAYAQSADNDARNEFIMQFNNFAKTQHYVQQPAVFRNGPGDLYDYLQSNIIYPEKAKKQNLSAQVFVSFIVDWKTGLPKKVKVVQSSNKVFNDEALRLINTMPAWTPAKKADYDVGMLITVPIYFHLD
jgi:protein TonB